MKHVQDDSKSSILVRTKWKLRGRAGNNAEGNFRRKISNQKHTEFLEANNAKLKMWLLADIMKLEPRINTMHELRKALHPVLPAMAQIFSPFAMVDGLSRTTKLLRASVTPTGAYHLALKFGLFVFESGVKR